MRLCEIWNDGNITKNLRRNKKNPIGIHRRLPTGFGIHGISHPDHDMHIDSRQYPPVRLCQKQFLHPLMVFHVSNCTPFGDLNKYI